MNYSLLITKESDTGQLRLAYCVKPVCQQHIALYDQPVVIGYTEDECAVCSKQWYDRMEQTKQRNQWLSSLTPDDVVYICGPMTGIVNYNREAFWLMEHLLKQTGCKVLTPARYNDDHPYEWYMRKGIGMVLDANTIVALKGWDKSNGACIEYQVATTVNNKIFHEQ